MSGSEQETLTCDYCDTEDLVYEFAVRGGSKNRCIPCLALEQGQQAVNMPFDRLDEHWHGKAQDWLRIMARIQDDDPIIKRDPDAIGTVGEGTRDFLTNVMGADAHHCPSEIADRDVSFGQATFAEVGGDNS